MTMCIFRNVKHPKNDFNFDEVVRPKDGEYVLF